MKCFIVVLLMCLAVLLSAYTDIEYPFAKDYEDDVFYPIEGLPDGYDRAAGECAGTLIIPSIRLKQKVFGGSDEEIQTSLSRWLFTIAREGLIPGKTHLCIYVHNSETVSLSSSRISEMKPGEYMAFRTETEVYLYTVDRIFGEYRDVVAQSYEWPTLSSDKIYIATCGRGIYRYKDVVVEGTLLSTFSTEEWETARQTICVDVAKKETPTVEEMSSDAKTRISVETEDGCIIVSVTDMLGNTINGATVRILTEGGNPLYVDGELAVATLFEGQWRVTGIDAGTYYIVSDSVPEGYSLPIDKEVELRSGGYVESVEAREKSIKETRQIHWIWILAGVNGMLVGVLVFVIVRRRRKK